MPPVCSTAPIEAPLNHTPGGRSRREQRAVARWVELGSTSSRERRSRSFLPAASENSCGFRPAASAQSELLGDEGEHPRTITGWPVPPHPLAQAAHLPGIVRETSSRSSCSRSAARKDAVPASASVGRFPMCPRSSHLLQGKYTWALLLPLHLSSHLPTRRALIVLAFSDASSLDYALIVSEGFWCSPSSCVMRKKSCASLPLRQGCTPPGRARYAGDLHRQKATAQFPHHCVGRLKSGGMVHFFLRAPQRFLPRFASEEHRLWV